MALGLYNNYYFDTPVGLNRLGDVKAYLFVMQSGDSGGIETSKVPIPLHPCDNNDLDLFNALGRYQNKMAIFQCIDLQ